MRKIKVAYLLTCYVIQYIVLFFCEEFNVVKFTEIFLTPPPPMEPIYSHITKITSRETIRTKVICWKSKIFFYHITIQYFSVMYVLRKINFSLTCILVPPYSL
jgi:hypothetical protein